MKLDVSIRTFARIFVYSKLAERVSPLSSTRGLPYELRSGE